jgi:hypothetical protein
MHDPIQIKPIWQPPRGCGRFDWLGGFRARSALIAAAAIAVGGALSGLYIAPSSASVGRRWRTSMRGDIEKKVAVRSVDRANAWRQTKALSPVMDFPTINVFISLVPS